MRFPFRSEPTIRTKEHGERAEAGAATAFTKVPNLAGHGVPVRSTCYGIVEVKGWNPYGGWRSEFAISIIIIIIMRICPAMTRR